ncbi:aspartyl protease family protein [Aquabacter sp. CN5-332]|uniref:aspartyl protease family protein n=1 Tax=Aquabacter sp. CN5-332 TaxID=3156608 RepID=UPI0032B478D4
MAFASSTCLAQAAEQTPSAIAAADQLFQKGEFSKAGEQYARIVAGAPDDYSAILQLGRIALLSNHLDDAKTWLERAIALRPGDSDPKVMLAETYYRRDDFEKAAASLDGVDVSTNQLVLNQYPTLNVAKLKSFRGQTPYEVLGDGQSTRLKFLRMDPLPLVSVRVNGGEEVTFFIDTGGSEVALDTEFARELGVPRFGAVQGTFSGGQHAEVEHGRIDALKLGDWTVRNLPAAILPLRQLSEGLGAKRIDGIIGTTLFYHFLTTLDYPRGELVLRRKNATNLEQFTASLGKSVSVPFWIASDHFMVGWGRVNSLPPTLLFVDTGLAGAGVKLAESVIKQAGIKLERDKAQSGSGGGGTLEIVPYVVSHLSFGDARQENVPGLYDGPFPWENLFGFHLAGMVGHDFFKRYVVTFDFQNMKIILSQ